MGFDDRCLPGVPAKMLCQKLRPELRCNQSFISFETIYVITHPNKDQEVFPGRHFYCEAKSAKDAWLDALAKVQAEQRGKLEVHFNPNTGEWSWRKVRKNAGRKR